MDYSQGFNGQAMSQNPYVTQAPAQGGYPGGGQQNAYYAPNQQYGQMGPQQGYPMQQGYGGQPGGRELFHPKQEHLLVPKADGVHVVNENGQKMLGPKGFITEESIKSKDRPRILLEMEQDITQRLGNKAGSDRQGPVISARAGPAWYDDKNEIVAASTLTGIGECVMEYRQNIGKQSANTKTNIANRPSGYFISYASFGIKVGLYDYIVDDLKALHGRDVIKTDKVVEKDGYYWMDGNIDGGTEVAVVIDDGTGTTIYSTPQMNGRVFMSNARSNLMCTGLFEVKLRREVNSLMSNSPKFYLTFALRGYCPGDKTTISGVGLQPVIGATSTGNIMSTALQACLRGPLPGGPMNTGMGNQRTGDITIPAPPNAYSVTGQLLQPYYQPGQQMNPMGPPPFGGGMQGGMQQMMQPPMGQYQQGMAYAQNMPQQQPMGMSVGPVGNQPAGSSGGSGASVQHAPAADEAAKAASSQKK